ncbi:hypothetical protein RD792_017190 [Penstemon davidsonii]|uniref:peroxidase n=1 Tax=Penstemon davidsonii TaxID=160366 RepID=A0ABR0CMK6_9LAMI|nr:hypothetical protein RD792_017190 [Penstemon davidsonii]
MGLQDSLSHTRSQILLMDPLPDVSKAFSLVSQEETQRTVQTQSANLEPLSTMAFSSKSYPSQSPARPSPSPFPPQNPAFRPPNFSNSLPFRPLNRPVSNNSYPRPNRPYCTHCQMPGHTINTCFKLHGYPPGYRPPTPRFNSNPTTKINHVSSDSPPILPSIQDFVHTLSPEQYTQLSHLFNSHIHGNSAGTDTKEQDTGTTTFTANAHSGICSSTIPLHASFNHTVDWILDSGASHHICNNLKLFTSVIPAINTTITLPNNFVIPAYFKGNITLPIGIILHDVLYVPHFKFNLLSGCDASILLDGSNSEKTAVPNLSVRGYEIIDTAKGVVEAICLGVVSCADIIVMATRDAVAMSGGGKYIVETGRRDGSVSLAKNVDLPSPSISVSNSIKAFANKGLNPTDMVYLLGGHTVGITHCSLIRDRIYNFQNTGKSDPNMDSALLTTLTARCPQNSSTSIDNSVNLDQNPLSSMTVDNSYYRQIVKRRGVLQIDQDLALDPLSNNTVAAIANGFDFSTRFGQAMIKLGGVQVLTGKQGEIRRSCRATNKRS